MVRYDSRSTVLAIKARVEEKHLTPQQVLILLEEHKEHVSLTTIRHVLAPGSENDNFNWAMTLQPLTRVLLEEDISDVDSVTDQVRLEGLEAVCDRMEELIEVLHDQIAQMKADHARICAQYEESLEFRKEQVSIKDKRMDLKDAIIADLMKKNDDLIEELRRKK